MYNWSKLVVLWLWLKIFYIDTLQLTSMATDQSIPSKQSLPSVNILRISPGVFGTVNLQISIREKKPKKDKNPFNLECYAKYIRNY